MSTTIAFTGVQNVNAHDYEKMRSVIEQLEGDQFVSGAAIGVDTYAARMAHLYYPEKKHTIVVSAAPYNKEFVDWAQIIGFEIIQMKPVKGGNGPNYMARNQFMIDMADELVAFPRTAEEVLRSGTWATIRRARKKNIPIHLHPLGNHAP